MQLQKAVFLDRDGVINRDSHEYIKTWAEFEFLPGSLAAMKKLTANGFSLFVITNQSAVGRKLMPHEELTYIHAMMKNEVWKAGGRILDIFYCPHIPGSRCRCRKPEPGLILEARRRYDIDMSKAFFIGDTAKDIACARNSGCGTAIWVKSGKDPEIQAEKLREESLTPDFTADDLAAAADLIIFLPAPDPADRFR